MKLLAGLGASPGEKGLRLRLKLITWIVLANHNVTNLNIREFTTVAKLKIRALGRFGTGAQGKH